MTRCAAALLIMSISCLTWAANGSLAERLVAELMTRHMPSPLYRQGDNSWPGGSYTISVFGAGMPEVSAGQDKIRVRLPLRIVISGKASNDWLGVKLDCLSSFVTEGDLVFTPATASAPLLLQSRISLPIPSVMADCGQMQLPIESYIRAFVSQQIPQWEQQLDQEINAQLMQKPAQ